MQVMLSIAYILILTFIIYKAKFFAIPDLSRKTLIAFFIIKILAGNVLWWIYTFHYPVGDLQAFFNDGNALFKMFMDHPKHFFEVVLNNDPNNELETWHISFEDTLYNDSHTMTILNMLFRFFSFGYVEIHIVFINFLSFIGLTALYKTFLKYFLDRKKLLIISIFFLPSVLFWGSGVLKEGLLFFGIGMLLYITDCGFSRSYSLKKILLVVFSILILLLVKFYVLIAFMPGLLANVWISRGTSKHYFVKYIIVFGVFISLAFILGTLKPEYNALEIISNKQKKSLGVAEGGVFLLSKTHFARINYFQKDSLLISSGNGGYKIKLNSTYETWDLKHIKDTLYVSHSTDTSTFRIVYAVIPPKRIIKGLDLQPTVISFLKKAPRAIWNVLTVPFIINFNGWLELLASIENLIYCFSLVILLFYFKRPAENLPIFYFCLTFVCLIFILAGLTTPIVGALIRYKTPALPFLMMMIFLVLNKSKLEKLPFIKKLFN